MSSAREGFLEWSRTPARTRRNILTRASKLLEERREMFGDAYRHDTTIAPAVLAADFDREFGQERSQALDSPSRDDLPSFVLWS